MGVGNWNRIVLSVSMPPWPLIITSLLDLWTLLRSQHIRQSARGPYESTWTPFEGPPTAVFTIGEGTTPASIAPSAAWGQSPHVPRCPPFGTDEPRGAG